MKFTVFDIAFASAAAIFYGSAAAIVVSWIIKNRRDIRFPQWLGIIAAAAVWPFSLIVVVMITTMDMSAELDWNSRRKS